MKTALANSIPFRPAKGRKIVALRFFIAALSILPTVPAMAVDLDEMTVVTVARGGSWGVATAASQGDAAAIRDCQAMAGAATDCGAQVTTTRREWVIANFCGHHEIIVIPVAPGRSGRPSESAMQTDRTAVPRRSCLLSNGIRGA